MKKISIIIIVAFLMACGGNQDKIDNEAESTTQISQEEIHFKDFKTNFIDSLWKVYPLWATAVGYHKYDDQLPIPNASYVQQQLDFADRIEKKLKEIKMGNLPELDQIDYRMIEDELENIRFENKTFKRAEWDPSQYNLGGAFSQLLSSQQTSLEDRLKSIDKKLDNISAYYEAAKNRLKNPTKVHTELAIQQLEGSKMVFGQELTDSLTIAKLNMELQEDIKTKAKQAVVAINGFISYLKQEVLPTIKDDSDSFRIGKSLYEQKFKQQLHSSYTAEEIFQAAVEEKSNLHDKMYRLSDMLWEKYFGEKEKPGARLEQIQMVIDAVSKNHVDRDSFIVAIKKQIPQLAAFVKEHDLLDLDMEKPLVVRPTPMYMRGVAGASISAPGPYNKNGKTFYNVTPLDDYSAEEAESYLREYNHYVLQILNIHEAIPGHYTQLVYSNQSPSIIKSVLGNGAMIEGWAVYAEKMMLENNYGGSDMEMGLMYYKWNLRTVCNAILDYGIHVYNYTEEQAMQLLKKEAFQEDTEAKGKWRRARLSQVQLASYFTGYYEILKLREKMRELKGNQFDLKEFHETFLSYGSAPVTYIREVMEHDIPKPIKETAKIQ